MDACSNALSLEPVGTFTESARPAYAGFGREFVVLQDTCHFLGNVDRAELHGDKEKNEARHARPPGWATHPPIVYWVCPIKSTR